MKTTESRERIQEALQYAVRRVIKRGEDFAQLAASRGPTMAESDAVFSDYVAAADIINAASLQFCGYGRESTEYRIPEYNPELHMSSDIAIPVTVQGYWSDVITIRIKRTHGMGEKPAWWPMVSYASGGFEECSAEGYLKATENFASALMAATAYARELAANAEQLEQDYQEQTARQRRLFDEFVARNHPERVEQTVAQANAKLAQSVAKFAQTEGESK